MKKLVLGAEIGGLGESQLEVAAALIYDRALDATERAQVESYLQQKYSTQTCSPDARRAVRSRRKAGCGSA